MRVWIDDMRPAPKGWIWFKTTNEALRNIICNKMPVDIISLDHDAGPDAFGGDFINILKEFERLERRNKFAVNFPIRLHSANPVGVANMRAIIEANGWTEIHDDIGIDC